MNKEIKEKWVAALRSGKYKQGQGVLYGGEQFCCLGVLCDVINPESWIKGDIYNSFRYNNLEMSDTLEINFMNKVGINTLQHDELTNMNDGGGGKYERNPQTFKQIADWIEENL